MTQTFKCALSFTHYTFNTDWYTHNAPEVLSFLAAFLTLIFMPADQTRCRVD